jgi:bacterioferritin-associated ferredoxin
MECSKKDKSNCFLNDHLVCVCMGVMQSDINDAINSGHDTFDKLQQKLEVGTGCSNCVSEINDLLNCKKK